MEWSTVLILSLMCLCIGLIISFAHYYIKSNVTKKLFLNAIHEREKRGIIIEKKREENEGLIKNVNELKEHAKKLQSEISEYKIDIDLKDLNFNDLKVANKVLQSDVDIYKDRVDVLEKGVESEFGIKVRKIVNKTVIDFTKFEIFFMIDGVKKLIAKEKNTPYDVEYYLALLKKLEAIHEKLPDDKPEEKEEVNAGKKV